MKRVAMIMAAAMAVDGLALAVSHAAPPPDKTIRALLRDVTQDALTDHDMRRLVSNFDVADMRHVISSSAYSQNFGKKLDARIAEINKDWNQKYGHDFDIAGASNAPLASGFYTTESGAVGITLVDIHGVPGGREMRVPLVSEKGFWCVSPPHALTADQLRENLLDQLSAFHHNVAQWPASESEAYRQVARHVMAAVLDKPVAMAAAQPAAKPVITASATASTPSHHWWQFWR